MVFNNSQKLIAGVLSLVLVAGMTSPAFAGIEIITSCIVDPKEVQLQLGPNENSDPIPKTITCDNDIDKFSIIDDCQLQDIEFSNEGGDNNILTIDETVKNLGDNSEEHCTVTFKLAGLDGPSVEVFQELWINEPQEPVAGELLSLDSSALVISGLASNAVWMIPAVAGFAGAGIYLKFRK